MNNPSHKTSQRRAQEAFTLVELLLVLVILGILAAIVLPRFSGVLMVVNRPGQRTGELRRRPLEGN